MGDPAEVPSYDDVWWRKVRGIFEGIVFEPEDVEVDLIAVEKPACPFFSSLVRAFDIYALIMTRIILNFLTALTAWG